MLFWIKKFAAIVGMTAFFVLFVMTIAGYGDFSWEAVTWALIRALTGAALFWVVGIVVADILFKGIISDMESDRNCLVEGGLVQQVHMIKEKYTPGGADLPFSGMAVPVTKNGKAGEKPQQKS